MRVVSVVGVLILLSAGVWFIAHQPSSTKNKEVTNHNILKETKAKRDEIQSPEPNQEVDSPPHEKNEVTRKLERKDDFLGITQSDAVILESEGETIVSIEIPDTFPAFLRKGDTFEIALHDELRVSGSVLLAHSEERFHSLGLKLDGYPDAYLHFEYNAEGAFERGIIFSKTHETAYRLSINSEKSEVKVEVIPRTQIIPDETPYLPTVAEGNVVQNAAMAAGGVNGPIAPEDVPALESNPGAPGVILLDVDGHTTSGTSWNTVYNNGNDIVHPAVLLNASGVTEIWKRASEDFVPFTVNVTTVESVFNAAPANQRIRVVISSESSWFGQAGGVAYYNSWNWTSDTPAHVFTNWLANHPKYIGECISHEVGHTISLSHDGDSENTYYRGHGDWATIMGASYYEPVTQWSRGEYTDANNQQDDLAAVLNFQGIDFRADTDGADSAYTAPTLNPVGTQVSHDGVIERNNDNDWFKIETGAGNISLSIDATGSYAEGNLNASLALFDDGLNLLATSNPSGSLNAAINSFSVTQGAYYIRIEGTGDGNVSTTGYSSYGSIGSYSLSGQVVALSATLTPTPTGTVQLSPTPTNTPTLTYFPTSTFTSTPAPMPTVTSTFTASPVPTLTPTSVSTSTPTPTQTHTITSTSSPTPSSIPSPTRTNTPTLTPTATPSPTFTIVVPGIDSGILQFEETEFSSYGGKQQDDKNSSVVVINQTAINLKGNAWKKYPLQYLVQKNTVLELTVNASGDAEIQGIGLEIDNKIEKARIFKLFGSQSWGQEDYLLGNRRRDAPVKVIIPVGKYFQGMSRYLAFVNDSDAKNKNSTTTYSDIKIYELSGDSSQVLFMEGLVSNYGGEVQNQKGESAETNGGKTLTIHENGWKKVPVYYPLTPNTIVSFRVLSQGAAEVLGLGIDNDTVLSSERFLQIDGFDNFGADVRSSGRGGYFELKIGSLLTEEEVNFLYFALDNDTLGGHPWVEYSNIRFFEDPAGSFQSDPAGKDTIKLTCSEVMKCSSKECRSLVTASPASIAKKKELLYEISSDSGEHWSTLTKKKLTKRGKSKKIFPVRRIAGNVLKSTVLTDNGVPTTCGVSLVQEEEKRTKKRKRKKSKKRSRKK